MAEFNSDNSFFGIGLDIKFDSGGFAHYYVLKESAFQYVYLVALLRLLTLSLHIFIVQDLASREVA